MVGIACTLEVYQSSAKRGLGPFDLIHCSEGSSTIEVECAVAGMMRLQFGRDEIECIVQLCDSSGGLIALDVKPAALVKNVGDLNGLITPLRYAVL